MAQYPTGPEPAVERCALVPLGEGQALLNVVARWEPPGGAP